jgi:hypothetical protein
MNFADHIKDLPDDVKTFLINKEKLRQCLDAELAKVSAKNRIAIDQWLRSLEKANLKRPEEVFKFSEKIGFDWETTKDLYPDSPPITFLNYGSLVMKTIFLLARRIG